MGQVSISILKRTAFRDNVQHFSNTYTYKSPGLNPQTDAAADALIDELVTKEKALHSNQVTFVRASMWSSGGTISQNQMIRQKTLSGTGSGSTVAGLDKERAVLVQWPAGVDSRGRPVKLKKWFHCCGTFSGVTWSTTVMQQDAQIPAADRTAIQNAVVSIGAIGVEPEIWSLCAESGRERTGDGQPVAHKYLEHHQFGEEWRG